MDATASRQVALLVMLSIQRTDGLPDACAKSVPEGTAPARTRLATPSAQNTKTGVPTSTNAYTRFASPAGRRTQPCDAGYDGTYEYSCIAIPPTK
jgi:hypothetical protein